MLEYKFPGQLVAPCFGQPLIQKTSQSCQLNFGGKRLWLLSKRITSLETVSLYAHVFIFILIKSMCRRHERRRGHRHRHRHRHRLRVRRRRRQGLRRTRSRQDALKPCTFKGRPEQDAATGVSCSWHIFYVKAASVTLSLGRDTFHMYGRRPAPAMSPSASFEKLSHICWQAPVSLPCSYYIWLVCIFVVH